MTLWLLVISKTRIEEENGLRVILVKKPVMPHRIIRLVSAFDKWNNSAKTAPILAPALSEGAKIPPDAPVENETIEPITLKIGTYHSRCFWLVNKVEIIISFPEPNVLLSIKMANAAIISPLIATKITFW